MQTSRFNLTPMFEHRCPDPGCGSHRHTAPTTWVTARFLSTNGAPLCEFCSTKTELVSPDITLLTLRESIMQLKGKDVIDAKHT